MTSTNHKVLMQSSGKAPELKKFENQDKKTENDLSNNSQESPESNSIDTMGDTTDTMAGTY